MTTDDTEIPKRHTGFATLAPERQRELASLGGKKAHELKAAHEWTTETARSAGMKGGRAVSRDREHMRRIGAIGGKAKKKRPEGA